MDEKYLFAFQKKLWIGVIGLSIGLGLIFLSLPVFLEDWSKEVIDFSERDKELKNQIGQMIMIGFRDTEASADSYIAKAIRDLKVGGVILFDYDVPSKSFPRNIINPEQTKNLISDLKRYSSVPLLVAVDAEGGKVNRLKEEYGFISVPSAKELGEIDDVENTRKVAEGLAKELKELGFNMNFAPVIDVDVNPENPVIGGLGRAFSADPLRVAAHARAFILVHHQNNIITVVKHFPGHGSSTADSHLGLVDVTKSYKKEELIPYQDLQKEGLLEAVMTAHIMNRNVDENFPATLSPHFLKGVLRDQIGFGGVVISDDAQMGAITANYGFEEAVVRMVNAGCNMIIISNNSQAEYDENLPYQTVDIIYNAVKEGKIPIEKITDSFNRIQRLKSNLVNAQN